MEWLVDPMECLRRDKPWRDRCQALDGRNVAMSRPTKITRTEEPDGTQWAFGHIHATRPNRKVDQGKIRLTYWSSPDTGTSLPALSPQECTHMADVLRAAAVNAGGSSCASKPLIEMLWDELMAIMDRLMSDGEAEDGRDPGRAEGVAYCIAVFQNPYLPNIENVRAEAMERWESAQQAPEPATNSLRTRRAAARRARRG